MDKVIALDSATNSFRVFFPKQSDVLEEVRGLNVRRFHKDYNDPYWIVGTDSQSAQGLARIAARFEFIVDSQAATVLTEAFSASPTKNITASFAAGVLSGFLVSTRYDESVVRILKSCPGSTCTYATKVWSLPLHAPTIRAITHLVTTYGLTIGKSTLEQAQSAIKRLAWQDYAQVCSDIDAVIDQLADDRHARSTAVPAFAVLDAAVICKWVAGSAARQEKAKAGSKAKRTGQRATERALERGFDAEAATMTADQVLAVHANLQALAGVCDGAATRDDIGFSGPDAKVGRGLAMLPALEALCAAYARSFLRKYTRQLGGAAIEAMG